MTVLAMMRVIDYNKEPIPGLSKTNQEWLDILLHKQELR